MGGKINTPAAPRRHTSTLVLRIGLSSVVAAFRSLPCQRSTPRRQSHEVQQFQRTSRLRPFIDCHLFDILLLLCLGRCESTRFLVCRCKMSVCRVWPTESTIGGTGLGVRQNVSSTLIMTRDFHKSCDRCGRKKRRCDGGHPCR